MKLSDLSILYKVNKSCSLTVLSCVCFHVEEEQEFNVQGYLQHELQVVNPSLVGSQ